MRATLEHGVSRSAEDGEPGRFPQVAGLRFTFDARLAPGSRIVDVSVNGRPLEDRRTYTLATTNFLAIDGGDGYAMLKGARLLIPAEQGQSDFDILRGAVMTARVVAPGTDGSIKRLDNVRGIKSDCVETK